MTDSMRDSGLAWSWGRLLRRPTGIAESTRWLFMWLAVATLLLGLIPLATAGTALLGLTVVATVTLAASCIWVFATQRVPWGLEVVDALAIFALALAAPDPTAVFGYVFASVWFRGLYGTTLRSLTRCGLYIVAVAAAAPLWTRMPEHPATLETSHLLVALPSLIITVVVARQLGSGLIAREQTLRRDAALASVGAQLVGMIDEGAIRGVVWAAASEICATTPRLRLLKVRREGETLKVVRSAGDFVTVPAALIDGAMSTESDSGQMTVVDGSALDDAAGATLVWVCISVPEPQGTAWLLAGSPEKIPSEAILAVRSLVNQAGLALINSTANQELTAQARIDSLTGLPNRSTFTSELATELSHHKPGAVVHVLFVDLDDFKDVNDVLGHRAGDEVLVVVAARLQECTGPQDLCARLGGDEFAVLLRSSADAERVAQRMVEAIGVPIDLRGRERRVGVSIGIARALPGTDMEALIHQADVAMYAAKANGKGRVQRFDPDLLRATSTRLAFERELAAATAAGQIVVHYQPVLSLPGLACTAVEALVRWQHPVQGLLQPQDFIEAAERTGAIVDIGAFALRQACADVARWQEQYPSSPLSVHVNVSARQLDHDQFVQTVVESLSVWQLPPATLVLELTETVLLNSPAAIERVKVLATYGVEIAIDDFGTGYSSLTTLRSLPVNIVKLDTSFIAGAVASSADRTVLEAIVQMSTQLGLRTVAEGVERPEQQEFLEAIGTHEVQGFLYLRPVPADELTIWLQGNLGVPRLSFGTVVPIRPGLSVGS